MSSIDCTARAAEGTGSWAGIGLVRNAPVIYLARFTAAEKLHITEQVKYFGIAAKIL